MNVKSTKYTEEEIELIQSLKAKGYTWKEIEAETGRPAKSMSHTFSAMKKQKEKKPAKAQKEIITEAVAEYTEQTKAERVPEQKPTCQSFPETPGQMKRLQDNLIQFIQAAVRDAKIAYGQFQEINGDGYGKVEVNAKAGDEVYTFDVHCCRIEDTEECL